MKLITQLLLLVSTVVLLGNCSSSHSLSKIDKGGEFKILSYNIRNARGMDDVTDYGRVANVIKRINADCVALQELDSATERSRSLLVVEMPDYVICCTHLSLTQEDRVASIDQINRFLEKYTQKPVFLAGDLNADPSSDAIQKLSGKWTILNDTFQLTIPSDNPTKCIDYVLAAKNPKFSFNVLETKVEKEPLASDHLPVWVHIKLTKNN